MNTYIVRESVGKIREIARKELKGYWKPMAVAFFIYYLFTTTVTQFLDQFFAKTQAFDIAGQTLNLNVSSVGSVYTFVVAGAFSYGLALFALTFFRTKVVDKPLMFEGFSCLGKSFILYLLVVLKVFLWSLLFVIPGIVASFKYSMSFYVMCDHPEYSPKECIRESCRLMNGNKLKLFVLIISYLGWMILASLPSAVLQEQTRITGVSKILFDTVLNIPFVFVEVYVFIGIVVFYELVTRNLVVMNPFDKQYTSENNQANVVNADYEVHENVINADYEIHESSIASDSDTPVEETERNENEQ